ncbi:MOSC domain-containing protein [Microbulbifer bruguierae]|uniref:MOSC domain-containing protein n=1 Tax=Microbulbifer bruguierae TaxID=3029061 RepID=A0ABY8NE74_9GAMM|nr:MOSC N-terminal beta barrel domain-containing protein [Microbulbifer bruguierae]WGL16052.1 MOSC domain-containing protein [Microbulbifer bruguierae]
MEISALYHFPVKSLQGHKCKALSLDRFGAVNDRRWMLIDTDNQFVTQRRLRTMAQLKATVTREGVRLENPEGEHIEVRQPNVDAKLRSVRVWHDEVTARDAGDDAAHWLSEQLQSAVRLVAMGEEFNRPLQTPRADRQVGFADAAPLLVISQASLDDLNSRLAEPVSMLRFRPNLVVSGCGPFAEDTWKTLTIHTHDGSLVFDCTHPCARCAIPGLHPFTGRAQKEPLRTLASYRRGEDGQIYFGMNLTPTAATSALFGDPNSVTIHLSDRVEFS